MEDVRNWLEKRVDTQVAKREELASLQMLETLRGKQHKPRNNTTLRNWVRQY